MKAVNTLSTIIAVMLSVSHAVAKEDTTVIKKNRAMCSRLYVGKPVTIPKGFNYPAKAVIVGIGPEREGDGGREVSYRLTEMACVDSGCMHAGEVGEMFNCDAFQ